MLASTVLASNVLASNASNVAAARWLMAMSLGLHIVLSCLGVALPTFVYVVHRRGLKGDTAALVLARRWSKVAAVLFAVGAVSGTVLSFEMGLLWPGMMKRFGAVIGLPFALEGAFFFLEAILLGIYLYGWRGLPRRLHLATLVPVAVLLWLTSAGRLADDQRADSSQALLDELSSGGGPG